MHDANAVSLSNTLLYREMHEHAMEKMLTKLDMTQGDYTVCDNLFLLYIPSHSGNIGLPKVYGQCTPRGA